MRVALPPSAESSLSGAEAPRAVRRWTSGVAPLDAALGGGFAYGRVHEVYAAESGDAGAARGFAAVLGIGMTTKGAGEAGEEASGPLLWLRTTRALGQGGFLQASGWGELGGVPERLLLGIVPDSLTLLRTAADALRCPALGAVVLEGWGRMPELDLTASRRLALAAERSGVPLLLLRCEAAPLPSAAQTRWQVAAAPSQALPGQAPGAPAFDLVLLRQRAGPGGLDWRLEWHRDQHKFREAALPGAVVPVPAGRPAAVAAGGRPPGPARSAA